MKRLAACYCAFASFSGFLALLCPAVSVAAVNTFSGAVPKACSFENLDAEVNFSYDPSNSMTGSTTFSVYANFSPLRLALGVITVDFEPLNIRSGSKPIAVLTDPDNNNVSLTQPAYKTAEGPSIRNVVNTANLSKSILLTTNVLTNEQSNGRYYLNRGDYSYTVVISCLEGL